MRHKNLKKYCNRQKTRIQFTHETHCSRHRVFLYDIRDTKHIYTKHETYKT